MRTITRVDYDGIADLYDAQPYRGKVLDPELISFLEQRASGSQPAILDLACGTGSQLIANRGIVLAGARLIGLDRSHGMLLQARRKAADIDWVRGNAALLPFDSANFDFITCQFGFHHVADKVGMLRDVFRVLRRGGALRYAQSLPARASRLALLRLFPGSADD